MATVTEDPLPYGPEQTNPSASIHPEDSASQADRTCTWIRQQQSTNSSYSSMLCYSPLPDQDRYKCFAFKESEEHAIKEPTSAEVEANTYTPQSTGLISRICLNPDLNERRRKIRQLAMRVYAVPPPSIPEYQRVYPTAVSEKYWEGALK
jgi:hypothetical protein